MHVSRTIAIDRLQVCEHIDGIAGHLGCRYDWGLPCVTALVHDNCHMAAPQKRMKHAWLVHSRSSSDPNQARLHRGHLKHGRWDSVRLRRGEFEMARNWTGQRPAACYPASVPACLHGLIRGGVGPTPAAAQQASQCCRCRPAGPAPPPLAPTGPSCTGPHSICPHLKALCALILLQGHRR